MKFSVYANCQSGPIGLMLAKLIDTAELVKCPAVHTLPKHAKSELFQTLGQADVIVHQPIGPTQVASVEELKQEFPGKTFVSFPSIYFSGLFPQLCNLRHPKEGTINGPLVAYHDARVIRSFLRGESVSQCVEALRIEDPEVIAASEKAFAFDDLREQDLDVKSRDLIEAHIHQEQLFYTFNHPSNSLLWSIAKRIAAVLGYDPPETVSVSQKPYLDAVVSMVPDYLARKLDLAWQQPEYKVAGKAVTDPELVRDSYRIYEKYSDFASVCAGNRTRFNIPVV